MSQEFEKQFPELNEGGFTINHEINKIQDLAKSSLWDQKITIPLKCYLEGEIKEHCLSKKRVREAIEKVLQLINEKGSTQQFNFCVLFANSLLEELNLEQEGE